MSLKFGRVLWAGVFAAALLAFVFGRSVGAAEQAVGGDASLVQSDAAAHAGEAEHEAAGPINPLWMAPFVLLLASIALMPFIHRHWWEHWYPAVALVLGAVSASYYFIVVHNPAPWFHEMQEYVSFIVLLASLYVVSGGIVIHVARRDTPLINCMLLLFGAVIANFFGTTGASMLLIRPYLRMNKGYLKPYHIVFFIFIVSNCGGLLTPIGDPPLFLGYLKGVPFWWVLEHGRWAWALCVGILLAIFFVIDKIDHGKVQRQKEEDPGPAVFIHGIHNLLFIVLIVWAVFQAGMFEVVHRISADGLSLGLMSQLALSREVLMVIAAVGSLVLTSRAIHERNEFNYAPIREVAILFIGIFSTMVPALQWLKVNADQMHLNTPGQFYFTTGALSSVLDNAPTYLTFLEVQRGKLEEEHTQAVETAGEVLRQLAGQKVLAAPKLEQLPQTLSAEEKQIAHQAILSAIEYHPDKVRAGTLGRSELEVMFLLGDPVFSRWLLAISIGAVFFGACTYIGNGPNFMVKSIAEASGVQCSSFIGYVIRYALPILIPIYVVIWLVFLR